MLRVLVHGFIGEALDPEPELFEGCKCVNFTLIVTGLYKWFDMRRYVLADVDVLGDPAAFFFAEYALLKFDYSRRRAPA